MPHCEPQAHQGIRESKQGTGTPGVTSQGVNVKSEALTGEGLRSRASNKRYQSPAVTHTTRNPGGASVSVSLNFPFRDFLKNLFSFPKQTLQKDFVISDTGLPALFLASAPPLFSHEGFIYPCVPEASACVMIWVSLSCCSHLHWATPPGEELPQLCGFTKW